MVSLISDSLFFFVLTFVFCTVPVYDGRKRQLKVPDELRNIPKVLKRYLTKIPQYSLALLAYTVSSYTPPSGARQDQLTANLHIQFAVILQEPADQAIASGSKVKAEKDKEVDSEAADSEAADSKAAESDAAVSETAESEAAESD
jgi:hypothetical protein